MDPVFPKGEQVSADSELESGEVHERGQEIMIVRVKQPIRMIRLQVILLSLVQLVSFGCFSPVREAVKASYHGNGAPEVTREKKELTAMKGGLASGSERDKSPHAAESKSASAKSGKAQSEDHYVQETALKLAREHSDIKKIRICYDSEGGEWWIVLYQDAGAFYELKQYVWNVYLDAPQPFLVVERVSQRRLEDHLNAKEPNRSCKVLDLPKEGWPATLAATREDRAKDSARPISVEAGKGPGQARAQVERHNGKPLARQVREKRRRIEDSLASKEVGDLGHQPAATGETRQRLKSQAGSPAIQRARDNHSAESVTSEKKAAPPSLTLPSLRASSHGSPHAVGPKPTFRTASAGTAEGAETATSTSKTRKSRPVEPSQRQSSLTVTPDATQATGSVAHNRRSEARTGPTYFVFAYGSQMNHPKLLKWLETHGYDSSMVIDASPGILEGYDYVWNQYSPTRHGGVVNLEQKRNAKVWGLLIEFQDPLLRAFDEREGHPFAYSRGQKRVAVKRVQDGKTVYAWLYLAKGHANQKRGILPTREYKDTIIQAARFWGFPEDYVSRLNTWKTR